LIKVKKDKVNKTGGEKEEELGATQGRILCGRAEKARIKKRTKKCVMVDRLGVVNVRKTNSRSQIRPMDNKNKI